MRQMAVYRYFNIGKEGQVAGPPTANDMPNDAEAIAKAKQLLDGKDIEIWQAERIVGYVTPNEK
jgi:hypothetical protein